MKMTRHAMTLALAGGEDLQARAWAATCATCHGTNGKGPANDGIPALAGQTRQVLLEKLLAFKQGSLPATVMHQHAKGYSDEELARIAAFFARQSR
jgi:sulfide dehydrogenase cytochrome subunit